MQSVAITNRRLQPVTVVIEPWGDEVILEPAARCELRFTGPQGCVEIETDLARITVFGWIGAVVSVVRAGKEL